MYTEAGRTAELALSRRRRSEPCLRRRKPSSLVGGIVFSLWSRRADHHRPGRRHACSASLLNAPAKSSNVARTCIRRAHPLLRDVEAVAPEKLLQHGGTAAGCTAHGHAARDARRREALRTEGTGGGARTARRSPRRRCSSRHKRKQKRTRRSAELVRDDACLCQVKTPESAKEAVRSWPSMHQGAKG